MGSAGDGDGAGPRALAPREVFQHCVEVLQTSEGSLVGPDAHLVKYLADNNIEHEDDVDFLTDVFLGCARFAKMVDVVVDGFLAREGRNFLQKDKPMLRVTCYIAVIVVGATGIEVLDALVTALPRSTLRKVAAFLRFGWAGDALDTWVAQGWRAIYDAAYVDEQFLEPLEPHRGAVADLCDRVDAKLASRTTPKPAPKATVPEPFALTRPSVRVSAPEEPRPAPRKSASVPRTTYVTPIEQEALERKRRANRTKARETLAQASLAVSPRLAARTESERTRRLRAELRAKEEAELRVRARSKPVPAAVVSADVPIRLNAGAILREEKLARAEAEAEQRRLAEIEAGGFDAVAFAEREAALAAEAAAADDAEVRVRHLKGLIAHEDCALAKEQRDAQNRRAARRVRSMRQELSAQIDAERRETEEQNKRVVAETALLQDRVAKAKAAVVERKAEVVKDVAEASKALLEAAAQREAAERERRADVIREIRALELVPTPRAKLVDKTETSGCRFLTEMSYIELQERLAMLRARAKREEEARRVAIARERAEAEQALADKLATVALARAARQAKARSARATKTTTAASSSSSSSSMSSSSGAAPADRRVAELEAQLEAKRRAVQSRRAKAAGRGATGVTSKA